MPTDPVDIVVRLVSENGTPINGSPNSTSKRIESAEENAKGQTGRSAEQTTKSTLDVIKDIRNLNTESIKGAQKQNAELMKFLSEGSARIADGLKGMLTKSFEVVEMIYKKLSASSPLLQAIEQLFNLAWTIFFMPIGNKLGELLIPAVIELMDKVVAFWDEYGDGGLEGMVANAVEWGISALADFFTNIGDVLAEQTGWVGQIGMFLQGLGRFIQDKGAQVLTLIMDWSLWTIEHMGTIITLIGTFMSLHYALQLGTMAVIAASAEYGKTAIALGVMGGAVAAIGSGFSASIGSNFNMASGGYVPATPGGEIHRLGEGGEGEYVIPESKVGQFGGTTYVINNYMMGTEEMDQHIREVIRGEVSASQLRSGY